MMTHLIPTDYKGKLAHTHSYPIGAEAISAALQHTPQIKQLTLSFYFSHPALSDKPITIMGVSYSNMGIELTSSNAFIRAGWHEEKWGCTVGAVLRTQRARVKELLLAEGLPGIAQWLTMPRDNVWRFGRKGCAVLYSPLDDALVIEEH